MADPIHDVPIPVANPVSDPVCMVCGNDLDAADDSERLLVCLDCAITGDAMDNPPFLADYDDPEEGP